MRFSLCFVLNLALLCWARAETPPPPAPLLKQGNARVILVGDSITGQSRNHPAGFARQIDWALQQAYPGCHPNVVALGGSGAGVQAWLNFEKRSRTESVFLDVKGLDVKAEVDQPADVLVVMLGMNDVLAPYVADEPASWEQWTKNYRELITALKTRLNPSVIAVATATLCTEDVKSSPKNRVMDALNAHLVDLAREMGLLVLPTNQAMRDVLAQGRRVKPDFHVTGDYVHPNDAGHLAVAMGMLRGLGEVAAARAIEEQKLARLLDKTAGELPTLSDDVKPLAAAPDSERQNFRVRYWLTLPKAEPVVPGAEPGEASPASPIQVTLSGPGWEVTPATIEKTEGEFTATGIPEHRENLLALKASVSGHPVTREIKIPASWLAATGVLRRSWNDRQPMNPAIFRGPVEEAIEQGRDFIAASESGSGQPLSWRRYFPSVNFTGGDSPESVDFAALTHARTFEAGYAARWIHSDRDRPVNVHLSTQTFAGSMQMVLWLNGAEVYSGLLTGEPGKKKTIETRLHAGWNSMVFNLNHIAWQWQCSVHLEPIGDDSLGDLRYSVVPHETAR